jgi:hypothetical protein
MGYRQALVVVHPQQAGNGQAVKLGRAGFGMLL